MSLNRRDFLKASLVGGAAISLTSCSLLPQRTVQHPDQYAGAIALPDGSFAVSAFNRKGETLWQALVDTRCHSGCNRPAEKETLFFERRPGWSFYVLDANTGERRHRIKADPGEHFVGHGVFSPDGRWLYATASRYDAGEAIVAVYDATQGYRRETTFELHGIGPHELTLHPDGETLVIGLGGILTHPDYDRIKLNLDTMEPALILMNRRNGQITGRFKPGHHQQSARHVSVHPDGQVYVAFQYQGPLYETPPLLARLEKGSLKEFAFEAKTQKGLANYISSVIAHPESQLVAAASPVGGTAVIFRGDTGELVATTKIADCAGVQALAGGDFLLSSGQGKLVQFGANGQTREIASRSVLWDHHLV